jgi:hypothetical protein
MAREQRYDDEVGEANDSTARFIGQHGGCGAVEFTVSTITVCGGWTNVNTGKSGWRVETIKNTHSAAREWLWD